MVRLVTREQAKEIDQQTIANYGISEATLMQRAGKKMAEWIREHFSQWKNEEILILVGPGNNGGDGKVIARELKYYGFHKVEEIDFQKAPSNFMNYDEHHKKLVFQNKIKIIVDAIFGTGLTREISDELIKIIKIINTMNCVRICVDIPTGLDCNRGILLGTAIQAHFTLTVGQPKIGFFVNEGPRICGKIVSMDIGFPRGIVNQVAKGYFLFTKKDAVQCLPQRSSFDNKVRAGKVIVLAGSQKMPGAAHFVSMAALRTGAGYVTLCSEHINPLWPADFLRISGDGLQEFLKSEQLKKYISAVAVGPGLGFSSWGEIAMEELLKSGHRRVVVDADGLRILGGLSAKQKWPGEWILTPHAGELEKLLQAKGYSERQATAESIESDRFYWCQRSAEFLGCWVLLKGYRTVISDGKKTYVINTGNPALAKSGTGDVLTGIIVALRAQGLGPGEAALTGASLHGWISDVWVRSGRDSLSLLASDLVDFLPKALAKFRRFK